MKRTIILSSLVIGAGVFAWWLLTSRRQRALDVDPPAVVTSTLTSQETPIRSVSPSNNGWSETNIPPGPLTSKRTEDWFRKLSPEEQNHWKEASKRVMTAADTTNIPIEFWGRVLDQDGNPLEGVHIMASVRQWMPVFPASVGSRFVTNRIVTDSMGNFRFNGIRGDSLVLYEIIKDGYVLPERPAPRTIFGYSTSEQYRSNQDQPEVFRMYKLRGAEPTISYDSLRYRAVTDSGGPIFMNLVTGQYGTEPDPTADLQISVKRTMENPQPQDRDELNWAVNIGVRNGGVVVTDDIFLYQAPETGYQARLEVGLRRNVPGDINSAKLKIYVKTRDRLHARLELNYSLRPSGEPLGLLYKTCLNPSGSRNLEAVSEKNISDPDEIHRINEETIQ